MARANKRKPVTRDERLLQDLHEVFGGTPVVIDQRIDDVIIATDKHGDVADCVIVLDDGCGEGFSFQVCPHFLDVRRTAYQKWDAHPVGKAYKAEHPNVSPLAASGPLPTPAPKAANDNRPQAKAPPTIFTAADLQHRVMEPLKWVVPGYVPEGFTLFSGRPKIGKSWLSLDVGLGVARGTTCLGSVPCEKGDVLYLCLEDNPRRLQSRIDKLTDVIVTAGSNAIRREQWPANMYLAPEWPRADAGGLKAIEDWLDQHPAARLVIVDVLAMFRAAANRGSAYEQDYGAIKGLQDIASRRRIGIIGVHHNRKSASESGDAFDLVSGTLGLTGGADAGLILDRNSQGTTLYVRGRDIEEKESAVTFDKLSCRWRVLGEAAEVRRSDERKKVLDFLVLAEEPMTPAAIATGTRMPRNNIDRLLFKMMKDGEVEKAGRGRYVHPTKVTP